MRDPGQHLPNAKSEDFGSQSKQVGHPSSVDAKESFGTEEIWRWVAKVRGYSTTIFITIFSKELGKK